jgi:hypothetical protein
LAPSILHFHGHPVSTQPALSAPRHGEGGRLTQIRLSEAPHLVQTTAILSAGLCSQGNLKLHVASGRPRPVVSRSSKDLYSPCRDVHRSRVCFEPPRFLLRLPSVYKCDSLLIPQEFPLGPMLAQPPRKLMDLNLRKRI